MTTMPPEPLVTDPDVAATVRLLHRRQGWGRAAAASFIAFALAAGASSSAQSQGTPPPSWFEVMIIVLGVLTIAGIVAAVADTVLLRRRPPAVRAQARSPRTTRAVRMPTTIRPGTGCRGRSAGPGCC